MRGHYCLLKIYCVVKVRREEKNGGENSLFKVPKSIIIEILLIVLLLERVCVCVCVVYLLHAMKFILKNGGSYF